MTFPELISISLSLFASPPAPGIGDAEANVIASDTGMAGHKGSHNVEQGTDGRFLYFPVHKNPVLPTGEKGQKFLFSGLNSPYKSKRTGIPAFCTLETN